MNVQYRDGISKGMYFMSRKLTLAQVVALVEDRVKVEIEATAVVPPAIQS